MLRLQTSKFFALALILVLSVALHASAITISPVRVELRGDPGTTVGGDMTIINDQTETKTYYVSYENFEAQGDTGVPKFIGSSEGLATWLRAPSAVTIPAGEAKTVPYTISIPASATPGGYFSAIFWSATPPTASQAGQVAIGAKIGMLVLLSVNGEVAESAGLQRFALKDNVHMYTARPVAFEYGFANTGGDRVQPRGTVVVRNILGWVAGRVDANPGQGNVLPNTQRTFHVTWDSKSDRVWEKGFFAHVAYEWSHFAFGIYRARAHLTYGTQAQEVKSNNAYFVVVPWHLLVVIVLPLGLLWVAIRKALRSYKAKIIAQARAHSSTS